MKVEVAEVTAFAPGERRIVDTKMGEVGVFNIDGEYHALPNRCLHQGGPLCQGKVLQEITGEYRGLGTRVEERYSERKVIKCPWHGWEFDISSGSLIGDESISLPKLDVIVEEGIVYLDV